MGKLNGKVAVITGGSSGIGLGVAKHFVSEGARVFVTGRNQVALDLAVTEIGGNTVGIRADSAVLADIDQIYATVLAQAGKIDVLLLNAGMFEPMPLGEITEAHFDKLYNTNVRGLVFGLQKALPFLSEAGSVILTGSIGGSVGTPGMSVYGSTKAAVRSLVRSWILDLKGTGIRINVLAPGHTSTPGLDALVNDEQRNALIATIPLGRLGTVDDIGKAAVFLASDDSLYVNGIELDVDGGVAQY
ncbi:SDR family oxidoreductase [Pseudomonas sp. 10B1]|uniref:SDR family NAD(P)-dependent oxidoreductase n=2 Tax=Pseudomonadota TaxID=1224 RepID=UPI002AB580F8|nr:MULTISPECIES: SDR family oxidoreductase [unclassified Pseudomonas]MDY7562567.1 SDR family oxidoreductase [Pseudomonas sp. AB6]MEA9979637.1 SDR family oxidoreductase [Pseudomonas sp. RTS4]MEA9997300.1 SDR family oxidoreductase [Pseudomonas sp. AA4]MEB0086521.1 SDR family oxidoreductase [Pseudomonas sp. RTI1]MEB0128496.1 SDR family oxidoreductase [Pseudomonas sp. CCC1.2]